MMFDLDNPYRLDQGDISFDLPTPVTQAIHTALDDHQTHYVQTAGLPRLHALIAQKLRHVNDIPVAEPGEVVVTAGGMHALYVATHALLEPGDEIILPDPAWTATPGHVLAARATPVSCPLYESRRWGYDLDELESKVSPRTRAILINSPHNPTGGVLGRPELERIAQVAAEYDLWVISDEAYEDIVYDPATHVSIASLPEMYERTVPVYTFSKSYAMTGLRLGYLATANAKVRERIAKLVGYTASSVSTPIQWGAIGGMKHTSTWIEEFRIELEARRDLFYEGVADLDGVLSGLPPLGAFYAFLKIDDGWHLSSSREAGSRSWAFAEYLIEKAKVGCIPGVDFGPRGENYVRFCFSREREELTGALEAMRSVL